MRYFLVIIFLMTSLFTQAEESFNKLFNSTNLERIESPANNTFIIWVNGDADRFRPTTSGEESDTVRIDTIDRQNIEAFARKSKANIVLFIDQRGSDTWYKSRSAWGAHLWVYSNGKLIQRIGKRKTTDLEKKKLKSEYKTYKKDSESVSEVNQADPGFLTNLLNFSQELFPSTNLHLIYRGHSFASSYTPGSQSIAPFDYSHPGSQYNIKTFANSIRDAQIDKKLSTITFASCSMADANLAFELTELSEYMIATQVNILETSTSGFNFSFLLSISNSHSLENIVHNISTKILSNFKTTEHSSEYIRETPLSVINLKKLSKYAHIWDNSVKELYSFVNSDHPVTTSISPRYIQEKKKNGVPEKVLERMAKALSTTRVHNSIDLISTLDTLEEISFQELKKGIKESIIIRDLSPYSTNSGLSINGALGN